MPPVRIAGSGATAPLSDEGPHRSRRIRRWHERALLLGSSDSPFDLLMQVGRRAKGKPSLMVSSYLPELFSVYDHLAVMSRGRMSEVRPIEAWTPDTVLQAAESRVAE